MKYKIVVTALLTACILSLPLSGKDRDKDRKISLKFRLKAGYDFISSAGPGDDLLSFIDDLLTGINNSSFLNITHSETLKAKSGALSFGCEIELFFKQRVSLVLAVDYILHSSSGQVFADSPLFSSYTYHRKYNPRMKLIPITASARYHFTLKKARIYVGTGLGYYIAYLKNLTQFSDIYEEGEGIVWKSRGTSLIPHLEGGAVYPVTKNIAISLHMGVPIGTINSFEIRSGSSDYWEGETLTFPDDSGSNVTYRHRLTGLNLGLFITFSF
jgi:hypothetical protein